MKRDLKSSLVEDPAAFQINVRVTEKLLESIDEKRIELKKELGKIPSRSEVIRLAIENFVAK